MNATEMKGASASSATGSNDDASAAAEEAKRAADAAAEAARRAAEAAAAAQRERDAQKARELEAQAVRLATEAEKAAQKASNAAARLATALEKVEDRGRSDPKLAAALEKASASAKAAKASASAAKASAATASRARIQKPLDRYENLKETQLQKLDAGKARTSTPSKPPERTVPMTATGRHLSAGDLALDGYEALSAGMHSRGSTAPAPGLTGSDRYAAVKTEQLDRAERGSSTQSLAAPAGAGAFPMVAPVPEQVKQSFIPQGTPPEVAAEQKNREAITLSNRLGLPMEQALALIEKTHEFQERRIATQVGINGMIDSYYKDTTAVMRGGEVIRGLVYGDGINHLDWAAEEVGHVEQLEQEYQQLLLNAGPTLTTQQTERLAELETEINQGLDRTQQRAALNIEHSMAQAERYAPVESALYSTVYKASSVVGPGGIVIGGLTKLLLDDMPNGRIRVNGSLPETSADVLMSMSSGVRSVLVDRFNPVFKDSFTLGACPAQAKSAAAATASAPVQQAGWVDPTGQALTMKQYYTQRAMQAAGIDPSQWDPSRGFAANRGNVEKVYQHYTSLYDAHPELRWEGMGKLAGGTVLGGLEIAEGALISGIVVGVPIVPGEAECLQQELMGIQKDIFTDLGWQHQLYADRAIAGIRQASGRGEIDQAILQAWENIASGDESKIWDGNKQLLYREQHDIIQPGYDRIQQRLDGPLIASFTSWLAENPVPTGHRFTDVVGFGGNVMSFDDRWRWIESDMLPAYQALPVAERNRLINTPPQDLANEGLKKLAIEYGIVVPAEAAKSVFEGLGMGH